MANTTRRGLLQQPPETLDNIVSRIIDRPDLLSFGLTSKVLASIIFPRHIQYHTVSAPLHNVAVWQHLIDNRACAHNVRRVQVIHDTDEDYGSWGPNHFRVESDDKPAFDDDTVNPFPPFIEAVERDRKRERSLVLALQRMPNLRSFAWRRMCPPFISGGDDIWSALQEMEFFVDIRLFEDHFSTPRRYSGIQFKNYGVIPIIGCPIPKTLFGLCRFEFVHQGEIDCPTNTACVLDSLTTLCPSLEILLIDIRMPARPTVNALFKHGRWPNLSRLELGGFDISAPQTTSLELETFLTFHAKLSHLTLTAEGYGDFPRITLPPNALPNLTSVWVDKTTLETILACPCSPPRQIQEIKNLCLTLELIKQPAICLQGIDRDALRFVTVTEVRSPGDLPHFAFLFPGIECLDLAVDFDVSTWDEEAGSMRVFLIAEWAEHISGFRNLRVLRGIPVFYEDYPDKDEEQREIIERLAALFPRLEWFSVPHSRVDILRDAGTNRLSWRIT